MAQGPYRQGGGGWVDPQAPRGIVFRGTDDRLTVEVRGSRLALTTAAVIMGAVAETVAAHESVLAVVVVATSVLSVLVAGAWLFYPRTTIEIAGDRVTATEADNLRTRTQTFALQKIGRPRVAELGANLSRLSCLQFDHWRDESPGDERVPVNLLMGYDPSRLQWLCDAICAWLKHTGARYNTSGDGSEP
jgi:hypothetical protein